MAELADAPGLGPGVPWDVKVRLLSLALFYILNWEHQRDETV